MYNTKNKTQKAYKKNKPTLNLIPKNCVCVFPIEIVGGKTLVSNQGIMPNRKFYDKGSFLYGQEVFDGRSALKIQGEDSITLIKPERPEGAETGYNYYYAKPSVGRYYYGKPISAGNEALEISEDASFEDFISMKASQTVTLRFEYDPTNRTASGYDLQEKFRFTLVDNDIYNLYLIPELCEEKLMYIESHQEYYDDLTGLAKGCEITFATLGDKIQKSGKAIEQYCAGNAPGEFSVRPKVIRIGGYGTTDGQKQVIFDPVHYLFPTPVKYLQVEQQGPALTSTIYALGRRQEGVTITDEEGNEHSYGKIGPSKFLLPCEFIVTQPNPLNRTTTPTKNYFCFPDERVTMVTDKKLLEWGQNQASQPLEQVKNAGMISIGSNGITSGKQGVGIDNNSNPIPASPANALRKDYFDRSGLPLSYIPAPTETEDKQPEYDTSGSVYADTKIKLLRTDTMIDIMCKNAFIYNSQPIIPLSFYSTRPYYLRDIPLIGGIANFFKLGDIKLFNNTTSRKASHLCLFGDADLTTMCANLNGEMGEPFGSGTKCFPINFFGTNEGMYQKLGVNAVNTTFCVALTDQIQLNGTTWDTLYLGQSTYEDHTETNPHYIFPDTQQSLLVNSTLKPIVPANPNFIVDAIIVQSIFDGKIKISCYGPEENKFIYPEGTATILSNANGQNGNMRDGTNMFLLSNWEERFCVQEDEFTGPQAPHKKEEGDYTGHIGANNTFDYIGNGRSGGQQTKNSGKETDSYWGNTQYEEESLFERATGHYEKTIYEQTISYTDLGIASVTDKDTFITHFGTATFNADNSMVAVGEFSNTVTQSALTFNFETGVYEYQKDFELISVRGDSKGDINPPTGQPNSYFQGEVSPGKNGGGTLHYNQQFKAIINLGDIGIKLTIYDNSYASTDGNVPEIVEAFYPLNHNIASYYFHGTAAHMGETIPEKFQSTILVNDMLLKQR